MATAGLKPGGAANDISFDLWKIFLKSGFDLILVKILTVLMCYVLG